MPRGVSASKNFYANGVTPTQRKNLETLYAHLGKVQSINMMDFANGLSLGLLIERIEAHPHCGTVCCLAGNGPAAGIAPFKTEDWWDYIKRVFGADGVGDSDDPTPGTRMWDWLFDGEWADTDNTVDGGRARIRIALDQGIPLDFFEQRTGFKPLSYKAA